jgi:hypothetical protein
MCIALGIPLCTCTSPSKIDRNTIESLRGTERLTFVLMIISAIAAIAYAGIMFATTPYPSQLQFDMLIVFGIFGFGTVLIYAASRRVTREAIEKLKDMV